MSILDMPSSDFNGEEAKRDRDMLKKILELNTDGWWIRDLNFPDQIYLSSSLKKNLGYEDGELENSISTLERLVFAEDLAIVEKNISNYIKLNESQVFTQKIRFRHKNGSTIWMTCKGQAIQDGAGKTIKLIGVHFDITQLILLKNKLSEANKKLKDKNNELEQLIYTISHDLKSPVITCGSFLGFLKEDIDNNKEDEAKESIAEIEKALAKLSHLITDLIEINQMGKVILNLELIDTRELVTSLAKQLKHRELTKKVQIDVSQDLPQIMADKSKITQVFENLLNNAIKYSYADIPVLIKIYSRISSNGVEICIEDNGPGIDESYHGKIFKLFQRLDKSKEGTGIGLTIVSRIMRLHKGSVSIESKLGQGSLFLLHFPMEKI
ncbi:MAG: PAS domain-containing sensor histidine kinase [Bdellovibrionota bacterium]